MEADVLGADEVLAGRDVLRDGELQAVLLPAAPVAVGARVAAAEAGLVDLEPVARAVVRVNRAGCLRHVDEAGAGVLDYCALLLAGNFILFGFFLSFFLHRDETQRHLYVKNLLNSLYASLKPILLPALTV